MHNLINFNDLACISLLHESELQYEQMAAQKLICLHKELKHKKTRQLKEIKKRLLKAYRTYTYADYLFESVLLEIEICLQKLKYR